MKFKIAAVAVASMVSTGAMAASYDWMAHDPLEIGGGMVIPMGPFWDSFSFTVAGSSVVASTTVSNNVSFMMVPILDIWGGTYSLYQQVGAMGGMDDIALGAWAFSGTSGNTTNQVNLNPGTYYYTVSGQASGASGGLYTIASSLQPVPEPETYAMMLAGLAALGFLARRRQG